MRLVQKKQNGTDLIRKKYSKEQSLRELHASCKPGMTSKLPTLKMLEEIRPPTKYQIKLSSTQKSMERRKHAESMLRQSVPSRSNMDEKQRGQGKFTKPCKEILEILKVCIRKSIYIYGFLIFFSLLLTLDEGKYRAINSVASVSLSVLIYTIKCSCREHLQLTNSRCDVASHNRFTGNRDSSLECQQ